MMFDGAVATSVAEATMPAVAETSPTADDTSTEQTTAVPVSASADQRQEIIFVDGKLQDVQTLIAGLPSGSEVVQLDSSKDGLQQIADYLQGREGVDAIHLLSHGSDGTVELGNTWLNAQNIGQHSQALNAIGAALASDGDILIYGCDTGEGTHGATLLGELARLTQADVAASEDATGATSKGGDWQLERQMGQIDTASLNILDYKALLAAPADENYSDDAGFTVTSNDFVLDGIRYVLVGSNTYTSSIDTGAIGSGNELLFDFPGDLGGLSSVTISAADGSAFNLAGISFAMYDFGGSSDVQLTPQGGTPLSYPQNGSVGSVVNLDLSGNAEFQNITSFTFSGINLILEIDNLNFEAAVPPNTTPVIGNLNNDSVAWAGVGNTVVIDVGANAALSDTELGALNGGNGNWSGASLTVQRPGTAVSADTFGFDDSGALFTVSGSNLQSGGQTFATFTNTGGVLTISFTSSATTATTALVNDIAQRITYRSDTPAGDATLRFTLSDGSASTTADVTVTSDTIYVTNTSDVSTIDASNGVGLREAVAIAAADATGSQTLVFSSSLASQTITLGSALNITESLTVNADAASGVIISSSSISLGGGTTLSFTHGSGDTAAINSTISSTGELAKSGAGTLTLGSTSNNGGWSGVMSVTGGMLTAGAGSNPASTLSSGTLTLDGGTLAMTVTGAGSTTTLANNVVLGASGGTFNITGGGGANTANVTGVVSGGNLSKSGASILQLSGTNTYTGTTTVSAGTLRVGADANLGSGAVTLANSTVLDVTGATTIDNAIALSGNTTVSNSNSVTLSGAISGANDLTKSGSGTLTLSGTNSYSGTTVGAGTLSVSSDNNLGSGTVTLASGTTLAVTGATTIDNAISLSGNASIDTPAAVTLSGTISGANTLTKAGASTLTLSGTNSYSDTNVSAGTLSVASDGNLGSGSVSLANGTTLAVTGAVTIDNNIAITGTGTVSNSAAVTLSGVISGGNLSKAGASTLTLSGTNTYTGTTNVNAGTLSVGSDANLGADAVNLANGTTLDITNAITIDNALALTGIATINAGAAATLSGVISSTGGLSKTGASTLTLSATNTYAGATTVSAGTLLVSGSTDSATTVASGGTLAGGGTIDGAVTVQNGGTLSPGVSPGTLTVNGDLTMAAGSTLAVEINGTTAGTQYDQIIVNGAVDVSGATLSATHGYSPGSGDSYTIIVNDAADAVTGSFSGLAEGATVAAGGNGTVLTASYIGVTGNDFTLTAPVNPTVSSVSSISGDSTYKVGDTIVMVVNFSEAVFLSTGTIQLMLETGTTDRAATYLAGSGSSSLYFSYTVQDGDISSDLDFTGTTALVANGDTIQSGSFIDANLTLPTPGAAGSIAASKDIVIDGARPTASIVVADTALAAGETSTVTITFNEAVSGLAIGDFTVANGALSSLSSGDGGITWTATLTPTASITDTTNLITLDNTGVADAAGNTGTGTTDSNNYAIDTLRPTASIVVADTALAAGETSTVTITFNEAVSGLAIGDFTVANGALSGLSSGDGGITWTATLTPTASITDTTNLITLDNTGITDVAGNAGSGTTDSNNYAIDTARPTATIVVTDSTLSAGETSLVTISFAEAVSGFSNADLTVANGTLSAVSSSDGGITWTATFTPTVGIADTSNLITLNNTGVNDLAGNTGTGTTDSNNYSIDTVLPTATIVVADNALKISETSLVTITFSEAVSGFNNADLTVANGSLSAVSSIDGGVTWTATFTPTASITDTSNVITLDNSGVTNASGNAGSGTTDSNNYAIDTEPPTATIVVADSALNVGETSLVTITFAEMVSGFTNADLTVANGTLTSVSSSDGGLTWTATFTPSAGITDTSNLITLDNTGITDVAGNAGSGTTDSNNYAIDTARPTAAIVVADSTLSAGETSLVTITFSEAVSGFSNADLTVANGSLSAVSSGDGGITWTAILTPSVSLVDASNLITLDNTGVSDSAGNTGSGTTDSGNYAINTVRPTATIVVADNSLTAGETSLVTITFSEAVSGFSNADLTVANGSLSAVSSSDGGVTWTATFTPTASITDTSNVIALDNSGVTNASGNAGSGTTDSNNYAIDTVEALVIDNGDPEFRAYPTLVVADVPTTPLQPVAPPAPSPNISPLLPPPLFEQPTLGSGIPTLGNIFINNGALAPSFLAQVFASSDPSGGDGSGAGFLGFGGGDGGVFGASTLSNIFGIDSLPESTPLDIFDDRQWDENAEQAPHGVLGAPTLGQQLHEMRTTEQRQLRELALALSQFEGAKPQA